MSKLKYDIKRYKSKDKTRFGLKDTIRLIFNQSIWAIVCYRFGSWSSECKWPVLSAVFRIVYFFINKLIEILTGISISAKAKIGKGLYVGHFGCIFIHPNVIIGENFSIGQGVTIGTKGSGDEGTPVIGNNVYIGAGAKVLGGIKIGDNVKIGANAVVVCDVPENCTAAGVPAKIIKRKER